MNLNDQIKYEKFGMTHNQLQELRSFLVERMVDNMSTQDLVACLLYTSPSPRDEKVSRMPSSA